MNRLIFHLLMLTALLGGCQYSASVAEDVQCDDGDTQDGRRCVDGYWVTDTIIPECDGGDCCTPKTCAGEDAECGQLDDGCGTILDCGMCEDGEACGILAPYVCSEGECTPTTCGTLECGFIDPGCGLLPISCGDCTAPETCGIVTPNMCDCVPTTCDALAFNCGMADDACGGMLDCGTCTAPETCGGAGQDNICGCTPTTTCRDEGVACGTITDDCGNMVTCEEGCFTEISAGDRHTCAVHENGTVLCWGSNDFGQLGTGGASGSSRPVQVAFTDTNLTFSAVNAGGNHTCAIATDGTLWCWGSNDKAQLGIDPADGAGPGMLSRIPVQVPGVLAASAVSAGQISTCAIDGMTLKCWGDNGFSQLGIIGNPILTPTEVAGLTPPITAISTATVHTCAVADGDAYCWGSDNAGQLGNGNGKGDSATPDSVSGNDTYTSITTGLYHTCGITDGNVVNCWGAIQYDMNSNALGTLQSPSEKTITAMTSIVSSLSTSTCSIHPAGAECFGRNDAGQLGDGTMTDATDPVAVMGLNLPTKISAGILFSCAIDAAKEAYCWGRNDDGQLGDGSTAASSTPVKALP